MAAYAAAEEAGVASVESNALFDLGCAAYLPIDLIALDRGRTILARQPCLPGGPPRAGWPAPGRGPVGGGVKGVRNSVKR